MKREKFASSNNECIATDKYSCFKSRIFPVYGRVLRRERYILQIVAINLIIPD